MKNSMIIALVLLLCAHLSAQQNSRIFINEFLAANVTIDADIVDFDDYSDWIELYNDENVDVDLGGLFLTDDADVPFRWEIPPGTIIKAKGFLRFWADGYNAIPGQTFQRPYTNQYMQHDYFTTRYYHLNFKLSRGGEFIGLFRPNGALIDSVSYKLQMRDVSRGRQPDGSAHWLYFGEPTPNASNSTLGVTSTQFSENPFISLESGFYAGEQIVAIASASNDTEIRYTLGGSKPNSASELYTRPLTISQTTVLRARVFERGKLPSQIITKSYFINENISLPVISITFSPETMWDQEIGIYAHNYKEREIPIHFEFFQAGGQPGFRLNAGLQLTGQASLYYPQKSFTISAAERYGADAINYQIFPQRKLNSYKSLYLRNSGVPDHRSTFFRDALQHSLVLNKMDIDCQAYQPAVVFLNGEYWGLLNIRDKTSTDYLASLHHINPDEIDLLEYEGNPRPTVMSGDADNYVAFYKHIESTDMAVEENYRFIETWMDIDEYINYQICEIFYDNVFWPDQNLRMWRERKEGGKWRWILFDADFGFGMPNQLSIGYKNNTLAFATSSNMSTPGIPPLWATLIFRKLLENDEFKTKFIQKFASYLNTIFQPDTVLAVINQLQNTIAPEMPRHISRWRNGDWWYGYPIPDYSTWLQNVNVMKNFARNRPQYQRQHIIDYFYLAGTCKIDLTIQDADMGYVQINGVEQAKGQSTRLYFKGIPTEFKAIPSVGYKFVGWQGVAEANQNPITILSDDDSLSLTAMFAPVSIQTIPSVISADATFIVDNSPYYATGDVRVDSNVTLRIDSGVEILMPEKASILVNGRLVIEGARENPVIFASNEHARNWGALCLVNASDSSVISHLKIIGATTGIDFSRDKAAISGYQSNFSLQDVTFENVEAPVFVQYGNVSIKDCRLYTNVTGDLINVKKAESAVVENCEFMGNDCFDSDAIDFDGVSSGIIRGNKIYNIYGFNSDAIDLGEGAKDILIENNIIYNISDKGVSIGGGATATVRRNLIANCGQGVGIKDFDSFGYIEHNTFYANRYGIASFEKNIGRGGGHADVINCIIANSTSSSILLDELSELNISYSLANTDELPGLHDIRAEPHFINNLYLSANSPAIDAGSPLLPNDPDGTLPDLGAFPYNPQNQINLLISEIHYHPADGDDKEFIELVNAGSSAIPLKDFNLTGDIHYTFRDETIAAGEYIVIAKSANSYLGRGFKVLQWDDGDLPDGVGCILLQNRQGSIIDFVNYDATYWWPKEPNGSGPSLELFSTALENMVSSSWRSSYAIGGTPGRANNSIVVSGIYINEFLASNHAVNADDNGEYDDWIEIYNSTSLPVNLGGLYITDNLDIPCKYQIPTHSAESTTIPAGGFLLLWADGQTDQGVLHTNFKLDRAGEQIGLVQVTENDTVFIDSLTYAEQANDISYGRFPDGSEDWRSCDHPTPMASNQIAAVEATGQSLLRSYSLSQNYPNPFNSTTAISYQLSAFSKVELSIYNLLGQRVATLVSGRQQAGAHQIEWDASDFSSGVYFCRIEAGHFVKVIKLALVK
jgi:hypothetical protein